jgi:TolB-like protein/Tfp pilus assembly protein PilF/predicted Ser/Thr protein kinase
MQEIFSHYRVLRLLGKGGMGEVYLAEDERLGRTVALKVLNSDSAADSTGLRRFLREARTAASLSHPNIVSVYEIGEEEGVHFIAMEYVKGGTLREQIDAGPLEIEAAVSIGRQIAYALNAAHAAGVIHRDVKPENILLAEDRHVKVLDFGIAVQHSTDTPAADELTRTQLTMQGNVVGTLKYISPEQLRGQPADVRSDVFALGVVLYEMLAGRRPFEGATGLDYVTRVMNDPPDALARFNYSVPPALERIVLKCLEKNPDWRYQSARELGIDLAALERNPETSTATRTLTQIALPPRPRYRWTLWMVAVAALCLCAVAAGAWFLYRPGPPGSVAVLPFTNGSGDAALDYAAEGLSESLQRGLALLPDLQVASWSQTQRYRGGTPDPTTVARDLRVRSFVTGRLTRSGQDVALDVELIDTSNGRKIWSRAYERPQKELIYVEESVLSDVSPHLIGGAAIRPNQDRTSDPEAYDLYLRGRYSLNRRTPSDIQTAIARFRDAANKDPGYALAHSGLADAYMLMASYGIQPPVTFLPQAKAEAQRAVELDPNLAEAQTSYALALVTNDFNWSDSEASFRRALQLNRQYAPAHAWFAFRLLTPLKRYEEALIEIRRAIELEPNEPIHRHNLATILYFSRRFDDAIKSLHAIDPSYLPAARRAEEALCLDALGRPGEAVSVLGEADKAVDQFGQLNRSVLGYSYALLGRRQVAEKIAADSDAEARNVYSSGCDRAAIQAALGNRDRAIGLLAECFESRDLDFRFAAVDARYDPLRSDSRFVALLRKAGLQ